MSFKRDSCVIFFPSSSVTTTPENLSSTFSFKKPNLASETFRVTFELVLLVSVEGEEVLDSVVSSFDTVLFVSVEGDDKLVSVVPSLLLLPPHPLSPKIAAVISDNVIWFFIINPLNNFLS